MKSVSHGFTLIELMIVVAIVGILAAIAMPWYQGYIARSQLARVVSESGEARAAVEDCLLNGRLNLGTGAGECDPGLTGSNLVVGAAQAGSALPANTGVAQVADPLTLMATITATMGNEASTILAGRQVTWARSADGSWRCSTNAPANFRSAECP